MTEGINVKALHTNVQIHPLDANQAHDMTLHMLLLHAAETVDLQHLVRENSGKLRNDKARSVKTQERQDLVSDNSRTTTLGP